MRWKYVCYPLGYSKIYAHQRENCGQNAGEPVLEPDNNIFMYLYLYSVQYLHVLQDSKHYMTHPTVRVQSNSQITDIPLNERQRVKDDHLSMSLRFFSLPLGIGPNDRGLPF